MSKKRSQPDVIILRPNFKMTGRYKMNKKGKNNLALKIYSDYLPYNFKSMILNYKFRTRKLKRNNKSIYNEIVAHLIFKKLGIFKKHTEVIDITESESILRRLIYNILSKILGWLVYEK